MLLVTALVLLWIWWYFHLRILQCNNRISASARSNSDDDVIGKADKKILDQFMTFSNSFKRLLLIVTPALISLAFCPLTLFLHDPILALMWPPDIIAQPPNINDVITCFLTPAGLIYAIAFGFCLQEAVGKQRAVADAIRKYVSLLEQAMVIIVSMSNLDGGYKKQLLSSLLDELISVMQKIMETKTNKLQGISGHSLLNNTMLRM